MKNYNTSNLHIPLFHLYSNSNSNSTMFTVCTEGVS